MSRIATVAWRDFRHTVLTKAFLFAIIGVPLLIVGVAAIAGVIMASHVEPPLVGTVAIIDPVGDLVEAAQHQFDEDAPATGATDDEPSLGPGMPGAIPGTVPGGMPGLARGEVRVSVERITEAAAGDDPFSDAVRLRLENDPDLLAVMHVPEPLLESPDPEKPPRDRFDLLVAPKVDSDHVSLIERQLGHAIVRVRVERAGLDADATLALLDRPRSSTRKVLEGGEEAPENEAIRALRQFIIPMAFMMLIWGSTFTCGQHLLTTTIEEKSNKVMEVLLSAVSPLQLMTGKIIGQGMVGLIIMGVYSSLSIVGLVFAAKLDLIDPLQLVYATAYFFMAYFMVASLMAAVGSAVSDLREANSLLMPVMIVLMFPLMLWMPISQAPNGIIAQIFSFIPPAIPFVMVLRITAEEGVDTWQILLSIAWGYVCVLAMIWLAARIFRVGVLMQGKPPSPLELIRWLRYS
jgi:ABC-type Na+ efflux pump permease subunit